MDMSVIYAEVANQIRYEIPDDITHKNMLDGLIYQNCVKLQNTFMDFVVDIEGAINGEEPKDKNWNKYHQVTEEDDKWYFGKVCDCEGDCRCDGAWIKRTDEEWQEYVHMGDAYGLEVDNYEYETHESSSGRKYIYVTSDDTPRKQGRPKVNPDTYVCYLDEYDSNTYYYLVMIGRRDEWSIMSAKKVKEFLDKKDVIFNESNPFGRAVCINSNLQRLITPIKAGVLHPENIILVQQGASRVFRYVSNNQGNGLTYNEDVHGSMDPDVKKKMFSDWVKGNIK